MDYHFRIEPLDAGGRDISKLHLRLTHKGVSDLINVLRNIETTILPDQVGRVEIVGGELFREVDEPAPKRLVLT